ncbi:MAG: flagellar basal-body MS-ring/collar protein FliF [Bacillota bacterium]
MSNFWSLMSRWWSSLPGNRKSMYIVMAAAVIAAGFFFIQWLGKVTYTPLFTRLEPREANKIVEKLKELNVKYQLADQGATVMVPQDKVYELRMQMAGSGMLVGGGVGFEIFDQSKLGMTDFERRMDYLRALQEELRRTIVQLDEVEQARVHLVLPEPSVFIRDERPASASVTLKLSPLAKLKQEQVKAIIYLVASGVENLPPENVKVIDTRGNILSDGLDVSFSGSISQQRAAQQELKKEFERDLERRVQGMLERILGPGRAVAMVTVDLDFNSREVTRIEYTNPGVLRSEQVREEQSSSTGGAPIPVGFDPNTNIGGGYPLSENQASSAHNRMEAQRVYEIGQTQERVLHAPGKVKSLSTAVVLDGELTPEKETNIRNIVAAAIGFQNNQERQDRIEVISLAFNTAHLAEAEKEMAALAAARAKEERTRQWVKWGLQGLGVIFAFVLALSLLRQISHLSSGRMVAATLDEPIKPVSAYAPPPLSPEEAQKRSKQEQVRKLAREKPDEVAQLVKTWITED